MINMTSDDLKFQLTLLKVFAESSFSTRYELADIDHWSSFAVDAIIES